MNQEVKGAQLTPSGAPRVHFSQFNQILKLLSLSKLL